MLAPRLAIAGSQTWVSFLKFSLVILKLFLMFVNHLTGGYFFLKQHHIMDNWFSFF